jgi:drug/metabolite transporter (DMT)-like permease
MPLTNAILLTFSAPLWMPVIAWAVFRQRGSDGNGTPLFAQLRPF